MDRKDGNSPQCLLKDGRPERRPAFMANLQMQYSENKIKNLIINIPVSNCNPHRVLDAAIENWEDAVPTFNFRNVTLAETAKLISTLSESTAYGHDCINSIASKHTVNPSNPSPDQLVSGKI